MLLKQNSLCDRRGCYALAIPDMSYETFTVFPADPYVFRKLGENHILKKVRQGGITIILIGLIPIGKIHFQVKLVKFRQKYPKNSAFSPEAPIGTTGEYFNSISIKFRPKYQPKSSSFFQKISSIFLRADIFVLPCRSKVVKFYYKYIVIFQK